MIVRITKQAVPGQDRSPFAHTMDRTSLGFVDYDEDDYADDEPETARPLIVEPGREKPVVEEAEPARRDLGRPKTARGRYIDAWMEMTKCSRHQARIAATKAGYPAHKRRQGKLILAEPDEAGLASSKERPRKSCVKANAVPRQPITISMPLEILNFFKAEGRGYQTRIIETLARAMKAQAA